MLRHKSKRHACAGQRIRPQQPRDLANIAKVVPSPPLYSARFAERILLPSASDQGVTMSALAVHANHRSTVEIDGVAQTAFSEVDISETWVDVIDYRQGNEPVTRKLPGMHKVGDVTLKRGVTASN